MPRIARGPMPGRESSMRLILASIKPAQVEAVRQALAAVHVTRLTICDAHAYVPSQPARVFQDVLLEIAVNDDFLTRTLETLAAALDTEDAALRSRLIVLPMEEAIQIYRVVRGPEAI